MMGGAVETTWSSVGVRENHTVLPIWPGLAIGSPASVVASLMSTVPEKGRLVTAVALAKLSFDGGALRTAAGMASTKTDAASTVKRKLTCFIFGTPLDEISDHSADRI
jgi:hypothetical protein